MTPITETMDGSFLLELGMSCEMRERLADKLTLADGSVYRCIIIDLSLSGVAVSAEMQPEIGTPLAIGGCVGRVVRHLPNGFAVMFADTYNLAEVTRLIRRVVAAERLLEAEAMSEILV